MSVFRQQASCQWLEGAGWKIGYTKRLRRIGNPHAALGAYNSFVEATGALWAAIAQSAAAAEAEIDAAIDRMRGK